MRQSDLHEKQARTAQSRRSAMDSHVRCNAWKRRPLCAGRLLLMTLLLFTFLGGAKAEEVTIGSLEGAANNSYLPMNSLYQYSYTQQIYTAEEIGMAGTINSITVWLYGNANLYEMPFDIYMLEVDKEAFDGNTDWVTVTASDIVYSGTVTVHNTDAEPFTFNLSTPFEYSGNGNLLIAFNNTTGQWKSGLNGKVFGANDDPVRAIYARQDTGAYDPTNPTFTATSTTYLRDVVMLDITPAGGTACDKAETLETVLLTESEAMISWQGGSGTYNMEYKVASAEEWEVVGDNVTYTTFHFTTLQPATTYNFRVQSVCEGDATSGWKTISFTTACGAITNFPWTETFESYAPGYFEDPCWVNEHIEGGGSNIFKVYTSTSGMGGNTTHMLQLPDQAAGTMTKLVLPGMTLPENYEFSIDVYRSSNTYQSNPYELEGIYVYASTNGEIEGATELAFIPRHYQVSSDVIPAEEAMGWYTYEIPIGMSGTCYIILKGVNQYCTSTYMDNLTVKPMPTCPKPTGLAVTQNSIYAHGATITWTENGEASEWIVEYATDNEFTDVQYETANDNPTYTFQGLDPETTYYVRVKAHCGPNDESEYSTTVHFTTIVACPAPTGITVNPGNYSAEVNWNGTSDNYIVSYRTAAYAEDIVEHFDATSVPSGWTRYSGLLDGVLTDATQLTSTTSGWGINNYALGQYNMKVNIYGTGCKYWLVTPEFTVNQDLSFDLALTDYNNSDPIENNTLQADDRFVVLIYADDAWHILREWNNSGSEYVYNTISTMGENVTIDLSAYYGQDVKIAFYGESTNPADMEDTGGDNDLHIDNVICGIPYEAGEWQTVTVDEATATITGLTPETDYEVKVQGDCGNEGVSLETAVVSFTTLEGCPVPQNVEVDDITYNSATVNWDGYNDSYIVSYRMPAHADGIIEHFDAVSVPSGWTKWSGLLDDDLTDATQLTSTTGGWGINSYALGQYNMKVNIYGTGCKYWLVTPEFTVNQDLSFDLALTDYNNSDPIENNSLQADDRFVVLIYADDAWHILREWNNSGSEYVYNTISATGENVTIDLSAYYGKKVKIAFYGESTNPADMEDTGGDNDLHIDNIVCGVPVEAGEWETVEATESPVILTGLTPETPYEVKLQGFCDGEPTEESETVTFTTGSLSDAPIDLVATDITGTTATLIWTGYQDNYNVRYRSTVDKSKIPEWMTITTEEPILNITGLTPETEYEWQVQGIIDDDKTTEWSEIATFTTPEVTTITNTCTLAEGWNWVSFNIDITLNDLKDALMAALGTGTSGLSIHSQTQNTTYNGSRWVGSLNSLDVAQMYMIEVPADCEMVLEGMSIDPAEHPFTINSEDNWIGYPLSEAMTVSDAFDNIAEEGDYIMSHTAFAVYTGGEWRGPLTTLEPGRGYIYSSAAEDERPFVFPMSVGGSGQGDGNSYHWSLGNDYHHYQYMQPLVATIQIDGNEVSNENLEIGVFNQDDINVGVARLVTYDDYQYVAEIPVYCEVGDMFTFKLYDHNQDIECNYECTPSIEILAGERYVNYDNPVVLSFTSLTTPQQVIPLTAGENWVSFNNNITLDDLKEALVDALPGADGTIINSQNGGWAVYNNGQWRGPLETVDYFDVAQMYMINVPDACEITLAGMPLDPFEHPVTISNGYNWIGYPLSENMTLNNAFAGFVVNGDEIMSQMANAKYNSGRWRGRLTHLEPGQGYIYHSVVIEDRTFVFPISAKAVSGSRSNPDGYETHWPDFNFHEYEFNKPLVAAIRIDGSIINYDDFTWPDFEVAAFVGDECRGTAFLEGRYVEDGIDPYPVIEMPVYYTTPGDEVTFKLFNHYAGTEYDTYVFTPSTDILTGESHAEYNSEDEAFVILNLTAPVIEDIVLVNDDSQMGDDQKNTALISDAAGETVNVTLQERTLWKDNSWNTLCLPFSLTADEVNDILAPGKLKELDTENEYEGHVTGLEGTTLYLFFKDAENGIVAGVPYIIKWDGDGTDNIMPPMFNNVTIADNYYSPEDIAYALVEAAAKFDGGMFIGNFSSVSFKTETKSVLFLGDANTLYYPQPVLTDPSEEYDEVTNPYVPVTIGAFRAYFQLADGSKVRSFRMNLGGNGGEATGILSTENGQLGMENDSWYSVDGRKLLNAPKRKGLYIHNAKKVVIK